LDGLGKAVHRRVWKHHTAKRVPPHYAAGFISRRRREQSIVTQRCNKERLIKGGVNFAFICHDVANAFPSPDHDNMDELMKKEARKDERMLLQRYRRARVQLKGSGGGRAKVRIGCGATQGDSISPPIFNCTYETPVEEWIWRQENRPHSDICLSTFADDGGKTKAGFADVPELKGAIIHNDIDFNAGLRKEKMKQNVDKKTVLPRFVGRG
jgi:Reverse transcriptase (RNA-dependent DNA polymerase).